MEEITIKNSALFDDYTVIKGNISHYDKLLDIFLEAASWLRARGLRQWGHFLDGYGRDDIRAGLTNESTLLIVNKEQIVGTVTVQSRPDEWDRHIWGDSELDNSIFLKWIEHEMDFPIHKKNIRLDCGGDNRKLNDYYQEFGFRFMGSTEDGHSKYQKAIEVAKR